MTVAAARDAAAADGTGLGDRFFRAVYDAEGAYVHNLVRRLGVAVADVPDVVHDVFVVFHRRLADFDPARPVRPYLAGIAVRVASDHRQRAHVRREVIGEPPPPEEAAPGPDEALQDSEDRRLVLEVLGTLDEKQRSVLVLHDIEGHAMREIAEIIDAPLNTLYSRLRLAREKFAAEVLRRTGGAR